MTVLSLTDARLDTAMSCEEMSYLITRPYLTTYQKNKVEDKLRHELGMKPIERTRMSVVCAQVLHGHVIINGVWQ